MGIRKFSMGCETRQGQTRPEFDDVSVSGDTCTRLSYKVGYEKSVLSSDSNSGLLALVMLKAFDCETFHCWVPNTKYINRIKSRRTYLTYKTTCKRSFQKIWLSKLLKPAKRTLCSLDCSIRCWVQTTWPNMILPELLFFLFKMNLNLELLGLQPGTVWSVTFWNKKFPWVQFENVALAPFLTPHTNLFSASVSDYQSILVTKCLIKSLY